MNLSSADIDKLLILAKHAAQEASTYIKNKDARMPSTKTKAQGNSLASQIVTEIDFASQRIILDVLKESVELLDIGLLTEELIDDHSRFEKDYFWCIDPLDGTLPFTEGNPGYAVSIALLNHAGNPIIGVVADPTRESIYSAVKGQGVVKNEQEISINNHQDVLHCFFDRSFHQSSNFEKTEKWLGMLIKKLGLKDYQIHVGQGAVMSAIGVVESINACYFKYPKKELGGGSIWDFAATSLIVEEAGMQVSDAYGNQLDLNSKNTTFMNSTGVVFSSNKHIHQEILRLCSSNW